MYMNNRFFNVVNLYNGLLFSNKKEQTTDICNDMGEVQMHAIRKTHTKSTYCMIPFTVNSRKSKLTYSKRNQISGCQGSGMKG